MSTSIGGIDIIAKKKPGGSGTHISVEADGSVRVLPMGLNVHQATAEAIGRLIHALLTVDPHTPQGRQILLQVQNTARAVNTVGVSGK